MDKNVLQDYLNNLNPEQRHAATLGNQSAVILAAAGSGKTSTLTCRIAYLVGGLDVHAQNILAVTFTNKAAKEMVNRLRKMGLETNSLWIGTFHGICNKILRSHAKEAGLQKSFTIMDMSEQESFFKRMLRANGYDPKNIGVSDILSKINGYKEVGWRSNQLKINSQERTLYELYEKACINDNVVDFGELMLGCYELFTKNEHLAESYAEKFEHILVDEFQDTNELQYKWLKILASKHGNVFAVGDDDQCLVSDTLIKTPNGDKKINMLNVGDLVISKSGKQIHEKKVLRKFEKKYQGDAIEITFEDGKKVVSTLEHNWFAKLSKKHSPQNYFVYLMYEKNFGFRIGTSRVHSKGQDLTGVFQGAQHEHADKQWIVSWHENESLSRFNEIKYSLIYGIPTVPFVARTNKANKLATVVSDQDLLNKLYEELDTISSGKRLINDLGLNFDRPHHIPRSRDNKENVTITLCGDVRSEYTLHTLEYYTSCMKTVESLNLEGFPLSKHKKDGNFRLRLWAKSFSDIEKYKDKLNLIIHDANFIYKANFDGQRFLQLHAKELIPSMIMVGEDGNPIVIKDVKKIKVDTVVYDIDIEDYHNFFANGVLSHNSIYGFRGAKQENLNLLKNDFNALVIKIEKNYRSDANILEAANAVILNNKNRLGKNLVPTKAATNHILTYEALNDEEESSFIAGEIKRLRRSNIPYRNMAILYRTNGQSRSLEKSLNAMSIPYIVYGGFRFFDRQEVKHAMGYLRLAKNSNDNLAFLRVVNIPARAIGSTAIKNLEVFAQSQGKSLFGALESYDDKNRKKFLPFIELVNYLQKICKGKTLPEMVKNVIVESGLEAMYENDKKEGPERLDNLYELISAAEVFMIENKNADIEEFLAFSSLESDYKSVKRDDQADVVKLMTVHASKGLEFEVVFISGLEEGLFPHANSIGEASMIEEERRLMYVALTRAKTALYLSRCEERLLHGQRNHMVKSRFFREIPQKLMMKIK